jgi:hypothetical protein
LSDIESHCNALNERKERIFAEISQFKVWNANALFSTLLISNVIFLDGIETHRTSEILTRRKSSKCESRAAKHYEMVRAILVSVVA